MEIEPFVRTTIWPRFKEAYSEAGRNILELSIAACRCERANQIAAALGVETHCHVEAFGMNQVASVGLVHGIMATCDKTYEGLGFEFFWHGLRYRSVMYRGDDAGRTIDISILYKDEKLFIEPSWPEAKQCDACVEFVRLGYIVHQAGLGNGLGIYADRLFGGDLPSDHWMDGILIIPPRS